jgi:hypothetical protein
MVRVMHVSLTICAECCRCNDGAVLQCVLARGIMQAGRVNPILMATPGLDYRPLSLVISPDCGKMSVDLGHRERRSRGP